MNDQIPETTPTRVFKIGNVRIVEDESMRGKSASDIQKMLLPLYPQIENATLRERSEGNTQLIEWIAPAGRKG